MGKIKIIVADDHEIFRNGVIQLINQEPDMEVIGDAANGEEAIRLINEKQPHVAIMDISMPELNGIEASKVLLKPINKLKILFFSLYDKEDYVINALEMGAHGYVLKDTSNKIFLKAVREIFNGRYYFVGEVSSMLIKRFHQDSNGHTKPDKKTTYYVEAVKLSKREREILRLLNDGLNNKDIADNFQISVRTIETHRLNIMRKFKMGNIEEVLEIARKKELI